MSPRKLAKLVGSILLGVAMLLALSACGGSTGGAQQNTATAIPTATVAPAPTTSDEPVAYLTMNVDMTDDGFQPPSIFIPVGRGVQLVLRNRGSTEHHFMVLGLVPKDLLWLAEPEGAREEGVTDEEHAHHHDAGFVPFRGTSSAGIRPIGDEVHAYAAPGGMDVVLFIPTNTGTFLVQCPLHPKIVGKVSVF